MTTQNISNKQKNKVLDEWRDDLIDLTRRNKALHLPTSGPGSGIVIEQPDMATVIDRLGNPKSPNWQFFFPPILDIDEKQDDEETGSLSISTNLPEDYELITNINNPIELGRKLRNLHTRAKHSFIEKGIDILYVTVGVLKWDDNDPRPLHSPLIFIPVKLERNSTKDPFYLTISDNDWVVNPALTLKLQEEFGLALPELQGEEIEKFLSAMKRWVKKPAIKNQGWQLENSISLAAVSFAKEAMYRDLLDNQEHVFNSEFFTQITLGDKGTRDLGFNPVAEGDMDATHPPETLHSILDADGTQTACIIAAKQGKSFVMDGPPGSGKSTTIANIIAELMADKKSVLFVSEKAVALEVVKSKLDTVGLGEFVLELHSQHAKRKDVAQKLGNYLRRSTTPKVAKKTLKQVQTRRNQLNEYAVAVNEKREDMQRSLHDAIGRVGQLHATPVVTCEQQFIETLNEDNFNHIMELATNLSRAWAPIEQGEDFVWAGASEATQNTPIGQLEETFQSIQSTLENTKQAAEYYAQDIHLDAPNSIGDIQVLNDISKAIKARQPIVTHWLTVNDFESVQNSLIDLYEKYQIHVEHASALNSAGLNHAELPNTYEDIKEKTLRAESATHKVGEVKRLSLPLLKEIHEHNATAYEVYVNLENDVNTARELLGIDKEFDSLSVIPLLLEILRFAQIEDRPEATWINPERIQEVHAVLKACSPMIQSWEKSEKTLLKAFNENIHQLDLTPFYESDTDVKANISLLSQQGRKNRKQFAACSQTGRITKEMRALIPTLRSWKNLNIQIQNLKDQNLLGTYFEGSRTNIESIKSALSVADRTIELAGSSTNFEKLGKQLGLNQNSGQELVHLADNIEASLDHLKNLLASPLFAAWEEDVTSHIPSNKAQLRECNQSLQDLIQVIQVFATPSHNIVEDVLEHALAKYEMTQIEQLFVSVENPELFGPQYEGLAKSTNWEAIRAGMEWAASIRDIVKGEISALTAERLQTLEQNVGLEELFTSSKNNFEWTQECFTGDHKKKITLELTEEINDVLELVALLRKRLSDIDIWRKFMITQTKLEDAEVSHIAEFVTENKFAADQVPHVFEKSMLRGWLEQTIDNDDRCARNEVLTREEIQQEFQKLDAAVKKLAAKRAIEASNDRRPTAAYGQVATLKHEAEKGRNHRPIRDLLSTAGEAAIDVKPCFMMSPLSVSQFIPADFRFDCVIFDEASQVRPCDAIGSIYRGKQVIIAGDERQLPPTTFFAHTKAGDNDGYDPEDVPDFESVLKLSQGSAGIPTMPLKWHYRSQHEHLITFSNREFYANELITYPGAIETADDLGVHFHHVPDGIYDRGGLKDNVIEAKQVVEKMLFYAERYPNKSQGVVTFNTGQQHRIEVELEAALQTRPDLQPYFHAEGAHDRSNGYFIKNIESVQGDERDFIIFSIGYGKDHNGKLTMNFGPLNKEGGHRRLNVAITRAKMRVDIFSSITHHDFAARLNGRGVKALKSYLKFADLGMQAFADPKSDDVGETESPFEEDVLQEIKNLGYDVVPQRGCAGYRIDLAIRHPEREGEFLLGVECDGATYHSSLIARDRDRLRQKVLEGLGWKIHRIWSTEWFFNRENEIEKLKQKLLEETSQKKAAELFPKPSNPTSKKLSIVEIDEQFGSWAKPFILDIKGIKRILDLDSPQSATQLEALLMNLIEKNPLLSFNQIVKAIKTIHRLDRMGPGRKSSIQHALHRLRRQEKIEEYEKDFYSLPNTIVFPSRKFDPKVQGSKRPPVDVAKAEIGKAIEMIVGEARSITPKELEKKTLNFFGWGYTSNAGKRLINSLIKIMLSEKLLDERPNGSLKQAS